MTDEAVTPDPDKGEVLSIWATLQAMTEMAQLAKEKEAPDEAPHE
jgi:heme-degrading monooxygenase HmoA